LQQALAKKKKKKRAAAIVRGLDLDPTDWWTIAGRPVHQNRLKVQSMERQKQKKVQQQKLKALTLNS